MVLHASPPTINRRDPKTLFVFQVCEHVLPPGGKQGVPPAGHGGTQTFGGGGGWPRIPAKPAREGAGGGAF